MRRIYLSEIELISIQSTNATVSYTNNWGIERNGKIIALLYVAESFGEFYGARIKDNESGKIYNVPVKDIYCKVPEVYKETQEDKINRLQKAVEVLTEENEEYSQKVIKLTETIRRKDNVIKYQNEQNEKLAAAIRKYSEETTDWLNNLEQML